MPDVTIEQLANKCTDKGYRFGSIYQPYYGQYVVTAHDKKLAGREPNLDELRDIIDYQYEMDAWFRRGLVILAVDEDPNAAIELAIEHLENL